MKKEELEIRMGEIKSERGRIVTNFAYIENLIKMACSLHYLGKIDQKFMSEVLEDDYFNFGLLTHIFQKVLTKNPSFEFPIGKLFELSKHRNIIAHAQIKAYHENGEVTDIRFYHGGERKEIGPIFSRYDELSKEIREKLNLFPGVEQTLISL